MAAKCPVCWHPIRSRWSYFPYKHRCRRCETKLVMSNSWLLRLLGVMLLEGGVAFACIYYDLLSEFELQLYYLPIGWATYFWLSRKLEYRKVKKRRF